MQTRIYIIVAFAMAFSLPQFQGTRCFAFGDKPTVAIIVEWTNKRVSKTKFQSVVLGDECNQYLKVRLKPTQPRQKRGKVWEMRITNWKLQTKSLGNGAARRFNLSIDKNQKEFEFLNDLANAPVMVHLKPNGDVEKVERPKKFRQLRNIPDVAKPHVDTLVAADYLLALASNAFKRFPKDLRNVRPGDNWETADRGNPLSLQHFSGGAFRYGSKYMVEKVENNLVYLTTTSSIEQLPGQRNGDTTVIKTKFTKNESSGRMVIERTTNRVIQADLSIRLNGTWRQIDSDENEITGTLAVFSKVRLHEEK